jgi:hypothetical protein
MLDFYKIEFGLLSAQKKKGTNLYLFAPFKGKKIKLSTTSFYQSEFLAS